MDFHFSPTRQNAIMSIPGWITWCGTMCRTPDGTCHLFLSMWEEEYGFELGWVTHSKVGYAVADNPSGPYNFKGVILGGSGIPDSWDRDVMHNPWILWHDGVFYLYYTGNYGNGQYASHGGNQRVGLAWTTDPLGTWHRYDKPLLEPRLGMYDGSGTTNPSVCRLPDGRFAIVYKCWKDEADTGKRQVSIGIGYAGCPNGPFMRSSEPIFRKNDIPFAAEDPCLFLWKNKLNCLMKDMDSFYVHEKARTIIRFESPDFGLTWWPAKPFLFRTREIDYEGIGFREVFRMERPFLYLENDEPKVFFCSVKPEKDKDWAANIHTDVSFS